MNIVTKNRTSRVSAEVFIGVLTNALSVITSRASREISSENSIKMLQIFLLRFLFMLFLENIPTVPGILAMLLKHFFYEFFLEFLTKFLQLFLWKFILKVYRLLGRLEKEQSGR